MSFDSIEGFALSPQQKRLWTIAEKTSTTRYSQAVAEIFGPVDSQLWSRATREVIGSHEILRTRFTKIEGMAFPLQSISDDVKLQVITVNNCLDSFDTELILADMAKRYDDSAGVVCYCLLKENEQKHLFLLCLPTLCADEDGIENLIYAIWQVYERMQKDVLENDEIIQYADLAEWFNQVLVAKERSTGHKFWTMQERRAPIKLPFEKLQFRNTANKTNKFRFAIDGELRERLNGYAQHANTSLPSILLASWQILLSRLANASEIPLLLTLTGRHHEELQQVIGPLTVHVPFDRTVNLDMPFAEFSKKTEEQYQQVLDWQECFDPSLLTSEADQYPIGFAYHRKKEKFESDKLSVKIKQVNGDHQPYKLRLIFSEHENDLFGELQWDAANFTEGYGDYLLEKFLCLLSDAISFPQTTAATLSLITKQLHQQLVGDFNNTRRCNNLAESLHQQFELQAGLKPENIALKERGRRLTFKQLNERANKLAHYLLEKGSGPEVMVGVCLKRSMELMVAILAVAKAGAAYIPLDPKYPLDRLKFMIADTAMPILITQENLQKLFVETAPEKILMDVDWPQIEKQAVSNPQVEVKPNNLCYAIYTSGSTGRPKGVLIEHRNLMNHMNWAIETFINKVERPCEESLFFASISFDSTISAIFPTLLSGHTLTVVPDGEESDYLRETLDTSKKSGILKITPSYMDLMSEGLDINNTVDGPSCIVIAGEALLGKTADFWRKKLPHSVIINEYGPTETTVGCTYYTVPREQDLPYIVTIGQPVDNTQIHILDQNLQLVPPGVVGEIYIGGAGVGRGYLNLPELTRQRFVPDPFSDQEGARLYKSGDLARRLEDGNIEFLGRVDHQVKLHGYRIEPGEIESKLLLYPDIDDACVLLEKNDSKDQLLAFIKSAKSDLDTTALREFLHNALPNFMVPAVFVVMNAFPLNPNGKTDRAALLEHKEAKTLTRPEYQAPQSTEEVLLAKIWTELLKYDDVGLHDSFIDLGGDSIRVLQMRAQLKSQGYDVSMEAVFAEKTLVNIASALVAIENKTPALNHSVPFIQIKEIDKKRLLQNIEEAYPITDLQMGMLFYNAHSKRYHDIDSIMLKAPLSVEHFNTAVSQIVRQHPVLRTSFDIASFSEPLQLVHEQVAIEVNVEDWRDLSTDEQEQRITQWVLTEKERGFDWSKPGLLRFAIQIRSDEEFQLGFSRHHAILDGWSSAVFMTELSKCYLSCLESTDRDFQQQQPFSDYVALEREASNSKEAREFWLERVSEASRCLIPGVNKPSNREKNETRYVVDLNLASSLSAKLRQIAAQTQTSVKSVLLAAHMRFISLVCNSKDVLSGLVSNGRIEEIGGERALGLFLNTLPFRLRLDGASWRELIKEVYQNETEAFKYRRFPLAKIQAVSKIELDVLFNFTHFHVYKEMAELPGIEVVNARSFEEINIPLMISYNQNLDTDNIDIEFYFSPEKYARADVERFASILSTVIQSLASDIGAHYGRCSLLPNNERKLLLDQFNESVSQQSEALLIHELFEAQVTKTPNEIALVFEGTQLTYREVNERANQLASYLRKSGACADSIVGLCLERGIELVIALLGVLKSGAAYLPLDPAYPQERMRFMLNDARPCHLVIQQRFAQEFSTQEISFIAVDSTTLLSSEATVNLPRLNQTPQHLAYVIYTSGSTGQPKGVAIEHRSTTALLHWAHATFTPALRSGVLASTSICFDLSVFEIFLPLSWGGKLIMIDNILHLPRLSAEDGVTLVNTVPSAMKELVKVGGLPASVKAVALAGEPLLNDLVQSVYQTGIEQVYNLYGPTEDTTYSTFTLMPKSQEKSVGIGRAVAGTQLYVLDSYLQPTPLGVPGELYISGEGVAREYLNLAELTKQRFIANPFRSGNSERMFKTGDLVRYQADGNLEFLGRMDHQVKVRGFRIELGEIEAALIKHPQIKDVVVSAYEEATKGKQLVAYIVVSTVQATNNSEAVEILPVSEIRKFLRSKLPAFMLPDAIVQLEQLPLTQNGKIDRNSLPDPVSSTAQKKSRIPPKSLTEKVLAEVWQTTLGVDEVGVTDHFFEIGGNSLIMLQVQSKINTKLELASPLHITDLFTYTTIRELASYIDQSDESIETLSQELTERAARQKAARLRKKAQIKIG